MSAVCVLCDRQHMHIPCTFRLTVLGAAMALSAPARRFSSRSQPTRLTGWDGMIGTGGGSWRGSLYLASADWALHAPWLTAVGCTLLWEALDDHYRFRDDITRERERIRRELNISYVQWAHSMRN